MADTRECSRPGCRNVGLVDTVCDSHQPQPTVLTWATGGPYPHDYHPRTAGAHGCDPCDGCRKRPAAGERIWMNCYHDLYCDQCARRNDAAWRGQRHPFVYPTFGNTYCGECGATRGGEQHSEHTFAGWVTSALRKMAVPDEFGRVAPFAVYVRYQSGRPEYVRRNYLLAEAERVADAERAEYPDAIIHVSLDTCG